MAPYKPQIFILAPQRNRINGQNNLYKPFKTQQEKIKINQNLDTNFLINHVGFHVILYMDETVNSNKGFH